MPILYAAHPKTAKTHQRAMGENRAGRVKPFRSVIPRWWLCYLAGRYCISECQDIGNPSLYARRSKTACAVVRLSRRRRMGVAFLSSVI